ncbi:MAG: S-methyl-5-thioribose-1-phosphate isomerase [Eggerthellaceae bacterium]|jgi:methylthioribose-1-phosphate isomerase
MGTNPFELHMERLPRTIELVRGDDGRAQLRYIDQRKLPYELETVETADWWVVVGAISTLALRGAPALGVAGAAACALEAAELARTRGEAPCDTGYFAEFDDVAERIASARPTAVNLRWGAERAKSAAHRRAAEPGATRADVAKTLYNLVKQMEAEDERANRAIGAAGAALLAPGSRVLTHCNAGSLATVFFGTALGVVYAAAAKGLIERVYADETRPVGQGARLTVWELAQAGVPTTLICDDMAASLMAQGKVDAVVVGADRIAANGDTANKIGTYGVAVLAHENGVPFYVAAPTSTIDPHLADGSRIPIEQRAPEEVLAQPIAGVDVWNPAFDVTPARYIAGIITERGVFEPARIAEALNG